MKKEEQVKGRIKFLQEMMDISNKEIIKHQGIIQATETEIKALNWLFEPQEEIPYVCLDIPVKKAYKFEKEEEEEIDEFHF